MDVRFLGFSIDFKSEKLTLDSMMEMLSSELSHQMSEDKDTGNKRILYFNDKHLDDFYLGMVVTVRNQKKYCHGKKIEKDNFTFDVLNLNSADKILEFNYFIINKKSGIGLYQHYHQSCAARLLGKMLKKLSATYSRSCGDAAIAEKEAELGRELKKVECSKIRKQFKSELNFSILIRQEKLKEILSEYAKIKSFEYEYATLTPDVQKATPLSGMVLKKKETLRFHTPGDIAGLSTGIANFISKTSLSSGRIKVENDSGDEIPLRIFDMPDYFAIYDFEDIVDKLENIKSSEFYKSKIVDYLTETYLDEQYDHIFQVKVRDES